VTAKEPEVRRDIQLADDMALAEFAAVHADLGNTVHHQHGRCRQLGITRAEIAAFARFEQIFFAVGRLRNVEVARIRQGHVTFEKFGRWRAAGALKTTAPYSGEK
jgi:hypothetical protein